MFCVYRLAFYQLLLEVYLSTLDWLLLKSEVALLFTFETFVRASLVFGDLRQYYRWIFMMIDHLLVLRKDFVGDGDAIMLP